MRFSVTLAVAVALSASALTPAALADPPDPVVVYRDTGHAAYFCEYEPSESGDSPDIVVVYHPDKGKQILYTLPDDSGFWDAISRLKPGTAITYDLEVSYMHNESGGGMFTYVGMSAFRLDPNTAAATSGCRTPDDTDGWQDRKYVGSVKGFFCGYEPSPVVGVPAAVAVAVGKGIYRISWVPNLFEQDGISAIPRDSPLDIDIAVMVSHDPKGYDLLPVVFLADFRNVGPPSPGACGNGAR
ncbi:MAG: hypothetical protein LBR80_09000 [Deltaproteobacteria bacterium]|jgi:hypothetical protein|nr:hypothetical protein [Deltaproteobacteria bacterium]